MKSNIFLIVLVVFVINMFSLSIYGQSIPKSPQVKKNESQPKPAKKGKKWKVVVTDSTNVQTSPKKTEHNSDWSVIITDNLVSKNPPQSNTAVSKKRSRIVESKSNQTKTQISPTTKTTKSQMKAEAKTVPASIIKTEPETILASNKDAVSKSSQKAEVVKQTGKNETVAKQAVNSINPKDFVEEDSSGKKSAGEKKNLSEWEKTWSILAKFSTSFDTNLEHDPIGVKASGFIPSITAGYQIRSGNHRLKFIFSSAVSRYTRETDLNRFGNYFAASYRYSIGKWRFETEAEASLKGTNEDRETNNQYILTQTIGYRFNNNTRLNLYAAYRLRRFPTEDSDRNAVNPQLGMKFSHQFNRKLEWNFGYRFDENRSLNPRQNYFRSTYKSGFDIVLSKDDLIETELSYRPRRYKERLVDVGDLELLRRDKKWSFDVLWRRNLTQRFGLETGYQFEKQNSNDIDKIYNNHQFVFSFYYHWGNGEVIEP